MPTLQEWAELTEAGGVVCGGLWAAWTFHRLGKARAAELDNRRKLLDVRRLQLNEQVTHRQLLAHQPNLGIQIRILQDDDEASREHVFLRIVVTLSNTGTENLEMAFSGSTVGIARIEFDARNKQTVREVYRVAPWTLSQNKDTLIDLPARILRAGQTRRMLFVARCQRPGFFLVQFEALYRRFPFEGEESRGDAVLEIAAIEQASCLVQRFGAA